MLGHLNTPQHIIGLVYVLCNSPNVSYPACNPYEKKGLPRLSAPPASC